GLRNLGLTPQDRAINFAATNAFAFEKVYESALREKMELESINVVRSPICRPGSDCWDVEVYFFYLPRAAGPDGAPGVPLHGGRQRHCPRDRRPDALLVHPLTPSPAEHCAGQPKRRPDMKLPVQAAAVVRESYSWPARRPSTSGGSAPGIGPA